MTAPPTGEQHDDPPAPEVADALGAPDPGTDAGDGWRRLSPRMLLIHPIRAIRDLLPALVPLVVVGNRGGDSWTDHLFNLGAGVLVLVSTLARWFTTRYRLTGEQVQLRTGLINRQTLTAPLDRVRTVDLQASPVHRVLGLTSMRIGTGAHEQGKGVVLDGLPATEGEELRVALLHRARAVRVEADPAPLPEATAATVAPVSLDDEVVLARFEPSWLAYAPLTTSGLVAAVVAWGFVMQLVAMLGLGDSFAEGLVQRLEALGAVVAVAVTLAVLVVASALGAVVTYLLGYWGTTVTRHRAGTLQVRRGLLTTRSTTLEERRVRGVRLLEPALLRLARGALLKGIVTGVGPKEGDPSSSASLLPATPRRIDVGLAAEVLGSPEPLAAPLVRHGVRATRRRWSRALQGAALVAVPLVAAWWHWSWPLWSLAPAVLALLAVAPLAVGRAAALGHALVRDHIVVREGAMTRRTDVLELDGVIGWEVRQTIFQRRAGLATLTALTAAGSGGSRCLDVPVDVAYDLVRATQDRVRGPSAPRRRER